MNNFFNFVIGILEITLLDLTLCADNIGIIALVTRKLPKNKAKLANIFGIAGAVVLRIIFACALTYILAVKWLPIKLIGGLFLVKVTLDFIKPNRESNHEVKESLTLNSAITTIIIADASMSLDNVLALAGATDGNILMLVLGILLNIPIIFFGSKFVAELMDKYEIIIYISGAILAYTSIKMILEDNFFNKYIHLSPQTSTLLPYLAAIAVFVIALYFVLKEVRDNRIKNNR